MAFEPLLGEIQIFAFGFAPRNWAPCDGQLLPIAQNTALFSLLGTTYGGDGVTTFAEDLGRWPELFPTAATDATDLHTALMTLAVFIEKAGTGGALFRRLQAEFLTRLAAIDLAAEPAARAYRDLATHWTTIAVTAASDSDPATAPQRWQVTNDLASELRAPGRCRRPPCPYWAWCGT